MWAWLRTIASISLGRNGKSRLRSRASVRRPWNRPQSRSIVRPQASIRCIDPVTVRAAPQKVTDGGADLRVFAMPAIVATERSPPRQQGFAHPLLALRTPILLSRERLCDADAGDDTGPGIILLGGPFQGSIDVAEGGAGGVDIGQS